MGITERRKQEKEVIKKKIIDAAKNILVKEGYENLSIRKIASKIEYSPGIIYHYFKDKAEIVNFIVEDGYGNILKTISAIPVDSENPDKTIENTLRAYIIFFLITSFSCFLLSVNDIEGIQEKVNILEQGIGKKRKSIGQLCKLIEIGIEKHKFRKMDIELTAQIILTSTQGLISRLILEKNMCEKQKERLINHHIEILIKGLSNN
ncbi:TetR family transcriptional regulator [Clostridium tetanomorphum DSM 665]|nr:TetR family transcriptional regulator [Clostridium tetanomorphum DSM 665]